MMEINLTADEAFTVFFAMEDALHNRSNVTGSEHDDYLLTEEEHKKLMGRYLRAALILTHIEMTGGDDGKVT